MASLVQIAMLAAPQGWGEPVRASGQGLGFRRDAVGLCLEQLQDALQRALDGQPSHGVAVARRAGVLAAERLQRSERAEAVVVVRRRVSVAALPRLM